MVKINFKTMGVKIAIVIVTSMTFYSVVNAQVFDGLFSEDKIRRAKTRKARVEKASSDVITKQRPSSNVNQAVRREQRAEEQDADVIEVNQGPEIEVNPFWAR